MPSSQIERKLAAIMFTDIAGYTAQMSKDEAVAISLLNKQESVLKPLISKHNGTYVKSTGDGSLSHFNSAVDAATCAKRFQESIYDDKDLNVRIGVHLGDTIFEKGDIRGDGVNIASRLESMAVEGGVFVSKEVHDQLANQKEFEGVSLGVQTLKGVGRLIEVYGLKGDKLNEPDPKNYKKNCCGCHSDDEVPSVVILPFKNKGNEEDEFYSYGIWLDIITEVSGAGFIRVASKKQIDEIGDVSIKEIPNKLCVRYIVNGELWKLENKFQLFIELYDAKESKVVWTDKWQENWENLSTIKGNLSNGLLKALSTIPKIEKKVETTNTEAYEYYLQGKYIFEQREDKKDKEVARGLIQKAIDIDDNLLVAKNLLGRICRDTIDKAMKIWIDTLNQAENLGDKAEMGRNLKWISTGWFSKGCDEKALDCITRSIDIYKEIDNQRGIGRSFHWLGNIYLFKCDYDKALEYYTSSLSILEGTDDKRGLSSSFDLIGRVYREQGDYDKALSHHILALEIREKLGRKVWLFISYSNLGTIYQYKGKYKQSINYLEKSIDIQNDVEGNRLLTDTTTLFLSYKKVGKKYNKKDIKTIINQKKEYYGFELGYKLYQLLDDTSYLETAYNQVQEKEDNLEPDVRAKFLSYPIPKAIVEEWEKVK